MQEPASPWSGGTRRTSIVRAHARRPLAGVDAATRRDDVAGYLPADHPLLAVRRPRRPRAWT